MSSIMYQADGTPVYVLSQDPAGNTAVVAGFASVTDVPLSSLTVTAPSPANVQSGVTAAQAALAELVAVGVGGTDSAGVPVTQVRIDAARDTVDQAQLAADQATVAADQAKLTTDTATLTADEGDQT